MVVRSPTWVGDAVMSLPALRELRRVLPGSHITVAAPPGTAEIFTEAALIIGDHCIGSFENGACGAVILFEPNQIHTRKILTKAF